MGKLSHILWGISFVNTRRTPEPEVLERNPGTWSGCFEHFWSEILLCLCCLLHQIKTASRGLSVSMNPGGGGESMISAAYLLSRTTPAKQRLNHFSLIAHVSQKSHLNTWTVSPTGLRPHFATSHYLIAPAEKMLQFTKCILAVRTNRETVYTTTEHELRSVIVQKLSDSSTKMHFEGNYLKFIPKSTHTDTQCKLACTKSQIKGPEAYYCIKYSCPSKQLL